MVVSADLEMAWAWRFARRKPASLEQIGLSERTHTLNILNSFPFPISWATVGHLMLDECSRNAGIPHPEMPRIPHFENRNWSFLNGDWYQHDPCTNYKISPAWYAPDIIREIEKSPVEHEIACHTFSHIDCSYEICPRHVFQAELEKCKEIFSAYGQDMTSFVFPGGTYGHYELLRDMGIIAYRKSIPPRVRLYYPTHTKDDLWQLPSSVMIGGIFEYLNSFLGKYVLKQFLRLSMENGLVFHPWFHPSFDYQKCGYLLDYLGRIANESRGEVHPTTMSRLANYCEGFRTLSIEVVSDRRFRLSGEFDASRFSPDTISVRIAGADHPEILDQTGNRYSPTSTSDSEFVINIPVAMDNIYTIQESGIK